MGDRLLNKQWEMTPDHNGYFSNDQCQLGVLMDIRDELKTLNRLLGCRNFTDVPRILRTIRANTTRKPKRKPRK